MSANTCTSTTGTVTGTDPNFTLTQKVENRRDGVYLYLKYTIGTSTSLTITPKTISSVLSSTDQYNMVTASGSSLTALTYVISAAGNYKIPIPLCEHDTTLVVTIVPNASAQSAAIVANIQDS